RRAGGSSRGPAGSHRRQAARSEGVVALQDMPKRQHQDAQVEPQRPVVDVVEVVLYPLLEIAVPTQVVDLRPTGDSCLDQMLLHVAGDLLAKTLDEFGPLG